MVLFIPTITIRLCSRPMGADDAPCRAVMGKRGNTGTAAGAVAMGAASSGSGVTIVAASAAETRAAAPEP